MQLILAFKHTPSKGTNLWDRFKIRVTKIYTKSRYFHVDIIIGDTYYSSSPDYKGVYAKKLQPLRDNYDYITIDFDGRKMRSFLKIVEKSKGKGYDWWGIFLGYGLKNGVDDRDKYFCSEICTELLQSLDIPEVEHFVPLRTSPADLYECFT